jgi:N-acetylneuraminate synthase
MTRVTVIAEAGVNHNGDLVRALALVDAAALAGADYVKFQTFDPASLASRYAKRAEYQVRNIARAETRSGESEAGQLAMLEELTLSEKEHFTIAERCSARGIAFMSSAFDSKSLDFLTHKMNLPVIKLGSGELTNAPLLWRAGRTRRRLILSTGMASMADVQSALDILTHAYRNDREPASWAEVAGEFGRYPDTLSDRVTLLHCTTEYPCPPAHVNLSAMDELTRAFGLPVGYSDHTQGIDIAIAAVGRGARVIEKHFTLDCSLPGPDHAASLEPNQLHEMIAAIRRIESALGDGAKRCMPTEHANALVARKSLVAARTIEAGELFSVENMTTKRPGNGRSPLDYWDLLGTPASRAYGEDELID